MRVYSFIPMAISGLLSAPVQAQTAAGDIAFIGINADAQDGFAFVALDYLEDGTEIYFTDAGWMASDTSFYGNEGHISWIAPTGGVGSGTIVIIRALGTAGGGDVQALAYSNNLYCETNVGTLTCEYAPAGSPMSIRASGESLLAYTGSRASPDFIAGLTTNPVWNFVSDGSGPEGSDLPAPLTDGSTAISVPPSGDTDNGVLNCAVIAGLVDMSPSDINDASNWIYSTLVHYDFVTGTSIDTSYFDPCPPVLPVELVRFEAESMWNSVRLSWITSSEVNNDYFSIERSPDGTLFTQIGQVAGAGTSTTENHYQLTDEHPLSGHSYYRLKQTDLDGSSTWSNLVPLHRTASNSLLKVWPNPTSGPLHVAAFSGEAHILTLDGRIVWTSSDGEAVTLHVSDWAPGTYIFQLSDHTTTSIQLLVVK